jgi:23S rRNA pseudouridine955/2504/2580 synthase
VRPLAFSAAYGDTGSTLLLAEIETGRTHQIRAHAAAHGHPLAGDIKYGGHVLDGGRRGGGFFLHAWKIELRETAPSFPHSITAPLPEAFGERIRALFGEIAGI